MVRPSKIGVYIHIPHSHPHHLQTHAVQPSKNIQEMKQNRKIRRGGEKKKKMKNETDIHPKPNLRKKERCGRIEDW